MQHIAEEAVMEDLMDTLKAINLRIRILDKDAVAQSVYFKHEINAAHIKTTDGVCQLDALLLAKANTLLAMTNLKD